MSHAGQCRRKSGLAVSAAILLLCSLGCNHPFGIPIDENTQSDRHATPFQQSATQPANSGLEESARPQSVALHAPRPVPFHESETLPPGTLLTVRLKNAVSAEAATPDGQSFEAIVDAPVLLGSATMIPQGATVAGRVESAHISKSRPDRDYVGLSLASIHVGGIAIPVQTATLFSRLTPDRGTPTSTTEALQPGRRLTFRFTEPVYIGDQQARNR